MTSKKGVQYQLHIYTATQQHVTLPSQPKLLEGSGEILHLRGGELCFWR